MYRAAMVFSALLAGFGCAGRKPAATYRLVRQGSGALLIPPRAAVPEARRQTFEAAVAAGPAPCGSAGGIRVQRHGQGLRITIARDALVRQPVGWLSRWAAEAEARGCIAPGTAAELAARIAEAVPLDPAIAWRLLNRNDVRAGYVELAAGYRLQVDSPILRAGAPPDAPVLEPAVTTGGAGTTINVEVTASPDLIGYERAWYAVRRAGSGSGLAIAPVSAERHVNGATEARPAPAVNHFPLDRASAYYRLLYRADRTIVVVGADTRAELERLSLGLSGDTAACQALAGHTCAVIPANVGVNPEILVSVNGGQRALPVGATVAAAIRAGGGRPEEVLPRLSVQRLYGGRLVPVEFDRAASDVLNLRLNGGEALAW